MLAAVDGHYYITTITLGLLTMDTSAQSNTTFSLFRSLLPFSPVSLKLLVGSGIVALSLSMTACSDADAINDQANATEPFLLFPLKPKPLLLATLRQPTIQPLF